MYAQELCELRSEFVLCVLGQLSMPIYRNLMPSYVALQVSPLSMQGTGHENAPKSPSYHRTPR